MASYWPTSTEPLAAPMNAIPKAVFSRSGGLAPEPTTALRNATEA
jgi:riboflavin biosynthesis pyrimidine reductase